MQSRASNDNDDDPRQLSQVKGGGSLRSMYYYYLCSAVCLRGAWVVLMWDDARGC
jgi:hypothetical protein